MLEFGFIVVYPIIRVMRRVRVQGMRIVVVDLLCFVGMEVLWRRVVACMRWWWWRWCIVRIGGYWMMVLRLIDRRSVETVHLLIVFREWQ